MLSSVLIVDDEKHTREGLRQALEEDYDVSVAASADEAFNQLEAQEFDVVLTELWWKPAAKGIWRLTWMPNRWCLSCTA